MPTEPAKRVGRRRFLRLGIGGAVLVAAGGVVAWHTSGYDLDPAVARRLRALTPKEYRVVSALLARLLRADGPGLPTPEDVEAALHVDALVAALDEGSRVDLKRLLHAIEHLVPLASGRTSRFTRLDGAAQDAVLAGMMTSSVGALRGAFDALKSVAALAYFRDARTWAAIGYDGPLVGRPAGGWPGAARGGPGT